MPRVFSVLALLSLALPAHAQTKVSLATFGAKVVGFRFFPSDSGFPAVSERFFRATFDSATTKYINMELEVDYPAAPGALEFSLTCRYEGPNGYLATPDLIGKITAGWSGSYHVNGWGSKVRGTWKTGTYNVSCREGTTLVASGSFQVTKGLYDIPAIRATVTGLRMFEGPKEVPELKTRQYTATFKNNVTRRVYFELGLDYPSIGGPATFPIECRYDFPDDRSFSVSVSASVQQGWTGSYHAGNVGYDETGKWVVGQYNVSCRFEGRVIAKRGFKIE